MKSWVLGLIVVAVLGAGGFLLRDWRPKVQSAGVLEGRKNTAVAERRTIRFEVKAAGEIGPAEQVSVRPEINGRIEELSVDLGDKVKKGQLLFRLDDKDLQTERASRLIDIERSKLQLERAKRNFERAKDLWAAKLISQELYEDSKTEFELGKNSLDRSEKELRLIEDRLTKTKIIAPFDCTVLTRPVSVGQAVSGSGGFNSGTEVLTVADLNAMVVTAHINQADVTRLVAGQEVAIQIESVPGLSLPGLVDRIAPQSTIKNNIRGYAARISLKSLDPRVLPGMTANLTMPIQSSENALSVPLAAVFTEQGERFVLVKEGQGFQRRGVEVGVNDYDFAEILKGLNGGEIVSLEPPAGEAFSKLARPAGVAQGAASTSSRGTTGSTNRSRSPGT